jgi:glyoxylase-like metal-dependent hydrolase (beta-lactamase superfamily II)
MIPLDIETASKGGLRQLAEDLFWARFDLPFRLNHVNLYMLATADGWVLIDTGLNNDITAQHWQTLLAGPLAGTPVCQIIVTHHHVDHIGYAGPLAALTGAYVHTSAAEAEHAKWLYGLASEDFGNLLAKTYHQYGLPVETVNAARTDGSRYRRNTAPLPEFRLLRTGDEITTLAGSWLIRTDRGHSDAQISLIDRQRGLFLSVDFLLPRISPNISADIRDPDIDLLSAYFTYLKEMTKLPDDMQVFPGHDWPFRNGGVRAQQLIDHHNHRLELLYAAAQTVPLTVRSAMDELFGRTFGAHEIYFASGEARAHLNHLVAVGRLHKRCDDRGIDIYEVQEAVTA